VLPSRAGVVLVPAAFGEPPPEGRSWVVCADPSAAFTTVVAAFTPPAAPYPVGIHALACVDASAVVAASAHVGPFAVVEARAAIGERTVLGAGCFVGREARLGADCLIYPQVAIREGCVLGDRVIVHCNTTIGSDGFGYIPGPQGHTKIPQIGIVQIDDDVEIGANVAVDRARFGRTWIKRGTKIDNLVQVAHNVVIGEHCFIVAQVGIAGSTRLGRGVIAAGQVGVAGHLEIGDGVTLMAQSGISKNLPAGAIVLGSPAVDRKEWVRTQASIHKVEKLQQALKTLQAEMAELRARVAGA
jgi:UDP-3-O-[3-hydroxymyristoyl] glucosamine N-acyltransferase